MKSSEVRKTFLDFFKRKGHTIVASAPMVLKDDPSLMFTNAGMNQFKDVFLGNKAAKAARIADTQKCLRVSGKHNDLEEVGRDTYHHTMFEMLGNWSFGDYFKEEAISWAWELLTEVYKIPKDWLYVTVFKGHKPDGTSADEEARSIWKNYIAEERILEGAKKDNFWEMGDTGPCGPCSEIHIDIRSEDEKQKLPGRKLVNQDHPKVIEIWNLVFIEFNRRKDGTLEQLPEKHVDTGMGFERLSMVLQGKQSNYDTDIFQPIIQKISEKSGKAYGRDEETDIAMRVISDHLRAVSFAIADGQLPSNTGAGYVIRRILRRAIRFAFTFLHQEEAFICQLVPVLAQQMGEAFPELSAQTEIIAKVIQEEEHSFLRTLATGIKRFEHYVANIDNPVIDGDFAFELYDTFGFPIDLTQLMASEKGLSIDMEGFHQGLEAQKSRSREDAERDLSDWFVVSGSVSPPVFTGYDRLQESANILRYRKVEQKKKVIFEIVLNKTPFYAEAGGQVGDSGFLQYLDEKIQIFNTRKENDLIIHEADSEPKNPEKTYEAVVDIERRKRIMSNHSATHLMHAALRKVLGTHVEQKGSLVDDKKLRFDFSHFGKMDADQIRKVEKIVNQKIREDIPSAVQFDVPLEEAKQRGAMALFGEKYDDLVRVVSFDPDYSIELCGGTHISRTGEIGFFKIVTEGAIAAGIRRIEAITAATAEHFVYEQFDVMEEIKSHFKGSKNIVGSIEKLQTENKSLQKEIEQLQKLKASSMVNQLLEQSESMGQIEFIAKTIDPSGLNLKEVCQQLLQKKNNLFALLGHIQEGKVGLNILISQDLVDQFGWNAVELIKLWAPMIQGGGGGRPSHASAGGKKAKGLDQIFAEARAWLSDHK